jgi:hypothetical protein
MFRLVSKNLELFFISVYFVQKFRYLASLVYYSLLGQLKNIIWPLFQIENGNVIIVKGELPQTT